METEELQVMIQQGLNDAAVWVEGDGRHFNVIVVAEEFQDKSKVQQQQLVYQLVNDKITSGELHAISLKTYTPQQWEAVSTQNEGN